MQIEVITNNEAETEAVGEALSKTLTPGSVVALYGDLGAGKTCFVRGLAAGLGVSGRVQSPTFTIVNEFEGRLPLFHFDLYRIASLDELYAIGWDDYLGRGGVCAVEWSENVPQAFDGRSLRVSIASISDTARRITIEGGGD